MNLFEWLNRQRRWSKETFGEKSTEAILTHIEEEIEEVRYDPSILEEWIDIAILALDGAMRQGYTPEEVCKALVGKQTINMGRQWNVGSVDEPASHVDLVAITNDTLTQMVDGIREAYKHIAGASGL